MLHPTLLKYVSINKVINLYIEMNWINKMFTYRQKENRSKILTSNHTNP